MTIGWNALNGELVTSIEEGLAAASWCFCKRRQTSAQANHASAFPLSLFKTVYLVRAEPDSVYFGFNDRSKSCLAWMSLHIYAQSYANNFEHKVS